MYILQAAPTFRAMASVLLCPLSCTVTETLNGEWELTLVHDIDERGKWKRLSEGCIFRAPVPPP